MTDKNGDAHTCYACGVSFTIVFDEKDAELCYCPHCGQRSIEEIDLIDDIGDINSDLIYDDDVDGLI